jgi:hypothetical protein
MIAPGGPPGSVLGSEPGRNCGNFSSGRLHFEPEKHGVREAVADETTRAYPRLRPRSPTRTRERQPERGSSSPASRGVAALVVALSLDVSMGAGASDLAGRTEPDPRRPRTGGPCFCPCHRCDCSKPRHGHYVSIGQAAVGVEQLGTTVPFVAPDQTRCVAGLSRVIATLPCRYLANPGDQVGPFAGESSGQDCALVAA